MDVILAGIISGLISSIIISGLLWSFKNKFLAPKMEICKNIIEDTPPKGHGKEPRYSFVITNNSNFTVEDIRVIGEIRVDLGDFFGERNYLLERPNRVLPFIEDKSKDNDHAFRIVLPINDESFNSAFPNIINKYDIKTFLEQNPEAKLRLSIITTQGLSHTTKLEKAYFQSNSIINVKNLSKQYFNNKHK